MKPVGAESVGGEPHDGGIGLPLDVRGPALRLSGGRLVGTVTYGGEPHNGGIGLSLDVRGASLREICHGAGGCYLSMLSKILITRNR